MSCEEIRQNLEAYADGVLSIEEIRRMETHFIRCEACKEEWECLRDLLGTVGSLPPVAAPSGFKHSVMDRIAGGADDIGPLRELPEVHRLRRLIKPLSLAASLAIVALTSYLLYVSQQYKAEPRSEKSPRDSIVSMQEKREGKGHSRPLESLDKKEAIRSVEKVQSQGKGKGRREGPVTEKDSDGTRGAFKKGLALEAEEIRKRESGVNSLESEAKVSVREYEVLDEAAEVSGELTAPSPEKAVSNSASLSVAIAGQLHNVNSDTLVVLGLNKSSLPREFKDRAVWFGDAYQEELLERVEDQEEERAPSLQRIRTGSEGKKDSSGKLNGGNRAFSTGRGRKNKEMISEGLIPSVNEKPELEYAFIEVEEKQLTGVITRLIQADPDSILGGKVQAMGKGDGYASKAFDKSAGKLPEVFHVNTSNILWQRPEITQYFNRDDKKVGEMSRVENLQFRIEIDGDQTKIIEGQGGGGAVLLLGPARRVGEPLHSKLDRKGERIFRILAVYPKDRKEEREEKE